MAHYAQINSENIVQQVIVAEQDFINTLENPDSWIQTSYNTAHGLHKLGGTPLRKNYAGVGYVYDLVRDAFIPPKPYTSWVLNEDTCVYDPPVPYPNDGALYLWNEQNLSWDSI